MKTRIMILGLCLVTVAAFGQANPKLKELQYFAGTWECPGKAYASPMGPEHATVGTADITWILGRSWMEVHYHEQKTAKNPKPYAVKAYWGYDEELKMLVAGSVDDMGGYATEQSAGWQGDKLTFEGPMHGGGMTMKSRDVFIKMSKDELHHAAEMEMNGVWKKMAEETCKRK